MALVDRNTLKNWMVRGAKPVAAQFAAWIDSYWHKTDRIPAGNIDGLQDMLDDFVKDVVGRLVEATKALQLQRRIAVVMETNEMIVPIGEAMVIYRASAKNVSKLEVKPNNALVTAWVDVPLNTAIAVDISNCVSHDALVRITRTTIDNTSTLYLFTKVIE